MPETGGTKHKADVVADALNRLLRELTVKCAKEDGVRDYFYVSVIGYGATVRPALAGALADKDLLPLSRIAEAPSRLEERQQKIPDGAGGLVEHSVKFPIWVEPLGNGGTPMCKALAYAKTLVSGFLDVHPDCFPPVVLNLTDGEATDGDPRPDAAGLRELASSDGSTLFFNLHVSSQSGEPTVFPGDQDHLLDQYAIQLFEMSSPLPSHMRSYAAQQGMRVSESSRGFVFNADMTSVVQFLDIGTRATDLR